jgi:hypothetical protein
MLTYNSDAASTLPGDGSWVTLVLPSKSTFWEYGHDSADLTFYASTHRITVHAAGLYYVSAQMGFSDPPSAGITLMLGINVMDNQLAIGWPIETTFTQAAGGTALAELRIQRMVYFLAGAVLTLQGSNSGPGALSTYGNEQWKIVRIG